LSNKNKSKGKKGEKNSGKKGKCSKCGKWESHTAEECTSNESPKKSEVANLATMKKIVYTFMKKIASRP
jgi:hypothetical protein